MSHPLVSIVMSAYNEAAHIREAIDSVLAQTYADFEFIIINDGSGDQTEAIIRSYTDPRIRYVANAHNLGLIDSLNKGLALANGTYIARMDADDICLPHRLERQVAFMEAHPAIGLSGAQLRIFGNAGGRMSYPLTHEEIALHLLITSPFGNNVVIFRKALLHQHQLFFPKGYVHAEDYKCWTSWVAHTRTANLDEELVRYRAHAGSVSMKHRTLQRATRNRVRAEYISAILKPGADPKIGAEATGPLSRKRLRALNTLMQLHAQQPVFAADALRATLQKLWYLDALEQAETSISACFRFPLIFSTGFKNGFSNWMNVWKHYLKTKLST